MRLITRCPFCRTLFKVAPDQLLISEGWVRCGQCREAFDATLQLLPPEVKETTQEEAPGPAVLADAPELLGDTLLPTPIKRSFGQTLAVKFGLSFFALFFLFGLLGQILVQERDRISAFKPGLKSWFVSLCGPLQCKVSPLRLVDSITIDSSALTRLQEGTYRINLVLKNASPVEVATPAIELTLTNSLEKPLVRRVIHPEEFTQQPTLSAAAELPATFTFSMNTTEVSERMTGYRLIAFYP